MQNAKQILNSIATIEKITYDNANGGAYSYLKFLANTRELLELLQFYPKFDKHCERIEAINWLFNEYLGATFTLRQKLIFENKQLELKNTFDDIRKNLSLYSSKEITAEHLHLAKAA
jgi:hypothetical protein